MRQSVSPGPTASDEAKHDVTVQWDGARSHDILVGLEPPETAHSGAWTSLDRAGVNRLIRILRKARDETFGKDA